jgi:hypothetical protein
MNNERHVMLTMKANKFTYQKNALDRATQINDFVNDTGGGGTINPSQILLSRELPTSDSKGAMGAYPNKHSLGGIALHELLYHISPLGISEDGHPEIMRNYYNLWTGGKISRNHHRGTFNW